MELLCASGHTHNSVFEYPLGKPVEAKLKELRILNFTTMPVSV